MSVIREERVHPPPPGVYMNAASGRLHAPTRAHLLIVAALCAVVFGVELKLVRLWHFGFDETWHVFMSSIEPFSQFVAELRRWEGHPPLLHLLLRWLTPLNGSELWPRLISILPSLGTILLAYFCALEMELSRTVALLAALLFASSSTHLNLAICVRGYSLSTMLTMAALLYFLRLLREPEAARRSDRIGFVLAALLAAWSEYSAVLVMLAAGAVLLVEGLRRPGFLGALWRGNGLRVCWLEPLVLLLGITALLGWFTWSRGGGFVGHLADCFPAKGEPLHRFAVRGFMATLDTFAPLGLSTARAPLLIAVLFVAGFGWLAWLYVRSNAASGRLRLSALAILAQVWVAIFFLATRELYPYGGRMRHQFVLFPFLALVPLFWLDELHRRMRSKLARGLLCIAFAAGTVATSIDGLRRGPLEEFSPTTTLWVDEVKQVLHERRGDDAIYTATIAANAVFSHLRDHRWSLGESGEDSPDLFTIRKKGSPPIQLVREKSVWWLPSPLDAASAKRLAGTLRRQGIKTAWVMALVFEWRPVTVERTDDEPTKALLAAEGLQLDRRLVFGPGEALRVILQPDT